MLEVEFDDKVPDRVEMQLAAETACGEVSSHLSTLHPFGIGPAVRVVSLLQPMADHSVVIGR